MELYNQPTNNTKKRCINEFPTMQRYTYVTVVGLLAVGDVARAASATSTGGDAQLFLVLFHVVLQVGQLRKRLLTALHRAAVRLLTCKQAQASA